MTVLRFADLLVDSYICTHRKVNGINLMLQRWKEHVLFPERTCEWDFLYCRQECIHFAAFCRRMHLLQVMITFLIVRGCQSHRVTLEPVIDAPSFFSGCLNFRLPIALPKRLAMDRSRLYFTLSAPWRRCSSSPIVTYDQWMKPCGTILSICDRNQKRDQQDSLGSE